jgi:ADP-dependent NAD(P)H-hydrate dehydratase / NAD(P)H-hydrate epimerase
VTAVLEGLKVVSAQEMARIEAAAYAEGASEQGFMETAGSKVADAVREFVQANDLPKVVTLLVGKGNNGGDGLAAGAQLIASGFTVHAFLIYPLDVCSPLCKRMHEKFRSSGGSSKQEVSVVFESDGIILDALVGTGFKGQAEGALAAAISGANHSGLPILAIDIPSGLNGTTGEVETIGVKATETLFLGLPKQGFFLKEGWDHVGKLRRLDFGLGEKYIAMAHPVAFLLNEEMLSHSLPPMKRTRHKYQAGYVLAVAGSLGMPGAAILTSYAALRAGAGMVRLMHPCGMEAELSGAPFELIRQGWGGSDMRPIVREALRAQTLLVGPGVGRTKHAKKMLKRLLEISLPMVVDADALFFLAEEPRWELPKGSVLTPHRGEMDLLLGKGEGKQTYQELCQAYVEKKKVTLVLKGAPTFVYHPGHAPLIITRGDPGMATAGSGDVLTGMIAAMIAQGLEARHASALAVYLHGVSGEMASDALTSYCMTASDLIDFLPEAFGRFTGIA